jgi:glycosyltransferase involved in cell wall biosynthesis
MKTNISVIVPVRNIAECIVPFYYELIKYIPTSFELIWVNDCSDDTTAEEIMTIIQRDQRVRCITMKKQCGAEAAIMAGLDYADGEYLIIMKGDLQHPADMIPDIIRQLDEGYEIVHTMPGNREPVPLALKWMMDICYHTLSVLKRTDVLTHLNQLRGFKKEVVVDYLFFREQDLSANDYFNWSGYRIANMEYFNKLNKEKHRKYTKAHLLKTARDSFDHTIPGFAQTFFYLGSILSMASLFFFVVYMTDFIKGSQMDTDALSLTSLLFAGGLQLLLYGSHKKKTPTELQVLTKSHQQPMNQNDFLSEYSFAGKRKNHALIES